MRVSYTNAGVETTILQHERKSLEKMLLWMRPLAHARPMIPAYSQCRDALFEIQRMFGESVKILEEHRLIEVIEENNGPDEPDPAQDDPAGEPEGTDRAEACESSTGSTVSDRSFVQPDVNAAADA